MEPFIGQIILIGFNFAPRGWALCDGQLLSISQNTALFSLLGTTYGGDGRTTFALPDLRSRVPVHVGTGPGLSMVRWGEKGGLEENTLTVNNLPAHGHPINLAAKEVGDTDDPNNGVIAGNGLNSFGSSANTSPGATLAAGTSGSVGNGSQFENRQPFLGLNYAIALTGIYPSRS